MNFVAWKYDGTAAFLQKRFESNSKIPTWAYDSLTEEQLGACARGAGCGGAGAGHGQGAKLMPVRTALGKLAEHRHC